MSNQAPRFRLLPHPTTSVVLFIVWVLLARSLSPFVIVGGVLLGFLIPLLTQDFWPEHPRINRLGALLAFIPIFLWDVLVANLKVAWMILNIPGKLQPRWIVIPLEIRNPYAVTTLANVISLTPGTVSAEVGPDRQTLLVHSLDVDDEQEAIDFIKNRYEAPIREIFE